MDAFPKVSSLLTQPPVDGKSPRDMLSEIAIAYFETRYSTQDFCMSTTQGLIGEFEAIALLMWPGEWPEKETFAERCQRLTDLLPAQGVASTTNALDNFKVGTAFRGHPVGRTMIKAAEEVRTRNAATLVGMGAFEREWKIVFVADHITADQIKHLSEAFKGVRDNASTLIDNTQLQEVRNKALAQWEHAILNHPPLPAVADNLVAAASELIEERFGKGVSASAHALPAPSTHALIYHPSRIQAIIHPSSVWHPFVCNP